LKQRRKGHKTKKKNRKISQGQRGVEKKKAKKKNQNSPSLKDWLRKRRKKGHRPKGRGGGARLSTQERENLRRKKDHKKRVGGQVT